MLLSFFLFGFSRTRRGFSAVPKYLQQARTDELTSWARASRLNGHWPLGAEAG
jgi:hypothetical protein